MTVADTVVPHLCPDFVRSLGFSRVRTGSVLTREGAEVQTVYYILQGLVKQVVNTEDGRALVVNLSSGDSLIGASQALSDSCYSVTTSVLRESRICAIPADSFLRMHGNDRMCMLWVSRLLSRELKSSLDHQLLLRTPSARGRVQRFFEWFAENVDESAGSFPRLPSPLKQVEIAQFLDLTPEHYNRTLRQLELEGLISRNRSGVHLLDPVCFA